MAQVKIYGLKTHLGLIKPGLSDVIHQCLVEAFKLPRDKRFHRFIALESDDFIYPADRSEKYTIIEIIMFEGRSVESKKHLIGLLYELFMASFGISAQDLEIVMLESPRHNWGIRGLPGDELALNYAVNV
jgi:phenylpyruvate tautomerase PptA (4-oxalocrotonate tautomerase family)